MSNSTKQELGYTVHPSAIVDEGAKIGAGTRIWHWVHVQGNSVIGERCSLGQNVYVGKAIIGNNVKIQNNVSVYDDVELEDDVFCGPSMVFTNVINPRSHVVRKNEYKRTLVKKGATIGANAVIVCGNTIGEYAMVGAGSVVTKNVPAFALVLGNPAKRVGWMCQCGIRLKFESDKAHCEACGWDYELQGEVCVAVR
ncbi:transferase, hexapeptide repeat protein [Candidatus Koribacter versatilis Ellin345]|uniref:Transferase, hexapeptide repeat protein n=1 Tax=Koribacter versatilis (strain Ellin345) TaxID=204669 RepID=Q1ILD4_KORVE|nr:acyltransferase [Candidatus Koribacter versatilis]ABF42316.1 transferase, hexapeptide repeat protein [Candidatus Koribacter versatilis Ellin345]